MSIEVFIKEPHQEFLDKMIEEQALTDHQEVVRRLVTFASKDDPKSNEDFFEYRCVGDCYDNSIPVALDVSSEAVDYLKRMVQQYDLEDYDDEAGQLGKAVRCLINYADQDGDQNTIFAKANS